MLKIPACQKEDEGAWYETKHTTDKELQDFYDSQKLTHPDIAPIDEFFCKKGDQYLYNTDKWGQTVFNGSMVEDLKKGKTKADTLKTEIQKLRRDIQGDEPKGGLSGRLELLCENIESKVDLIDMKSHNSGWGLVLGAMGMGFGVFGFGIPLATFGTDYVRYRLQNNRILNQHIQTLAQNYQLCAPGRRPLQLNANPLSTNGADARIALGLLSFIGVSALFKEYGLQPLLKFFDSKDEDIAAQYPYCKADRLSMDDYTDERIAPMDEAKLTEVHQTLTRERMELDTGVTKATRALEGHILRAGETTDEDLIINGSLVKAGTTVQKTTVVKEGLNAQEKALEKPDTMHFDAFVEFFAGAGLGHLFAHRIQARAAERMNSDNVKNDAQKQLARQYAEGKIVDCNPNDAEAVREAREWAELWVDLPKHLKPSEDLSAEPQQTPAGDGDLASPQSVARNASDADALDALNSVITGDHTVIRKAAAGADPVLQGTPRIHQGTNGVGVGVGPGARGGAGLVAAPAGAVPAL